MVVDSGSDAANTSADAATDTGHAPPADAGAPDTTPTQPVDAGHDSGTVTYVARCGLLPGWTPVYTVTCYDTQARTLSDPSVQYISWQSIAGDYTVADYEACVAPCPLGTGCVVHFNNNTYASGVCQ
jgi:hypothetical protein